MPKSRGTFIFTAAYVEFLHDEAIGLFWPGLEPVSASEYRDLGSIESALMAPFQTFDARPLLRGIKKKGAHLFHSLIANHPFSPVKVLKYLRSEILAKPGRKFQKPGQRHGCKPARSLEVAAVSGPP